LFLCGFVLGVLCFFSINAALHFFVSARGLGQIAPSPDTFAADFSVIFSFDPPLPPFYESFPSPAVD